MTNSSPRLVSRSPSSRQRPQGPPPDRRGRRLLPGQPSGWLMAFGHGGVVHGPGGMTARVAGAGRAGLAPGRSRMPTVAAARTASEAEYTKAVGCSPDLVVATPASSAGTLNAR